MEKAKIMLDAARLMSAAAEDLKECSKRLELLCGELTDGSSEQVSEKEAAPKYTLEQVRGVLADKSRAGHTAEIREMLKRYGADKLSAVDPKHYPAIMKEAEGMSDE
ncbi:hypothetical protein [Eubacterium sp. AB3007]|uniref:hypothetical protein n=1 Tax=Eubacterium sp. AB3007 TaxID=1392487 RepID=UPI00048A106B|nr:hypothetical protein [Eubacterium sp. AB3007]